MSYDKQLKYFITLILFITGITHAVSAEVKCPRVRQGKSLSNVDLLDGPTSDKAFLISEDGGWHHLNTAGSRFYNHLTLRCTYAGSKTVLDVVLPANTQACLFSGEAPQVSYR